MLIASFYFFKNTTSPPLKILHFNCHFSCHYSSHFSGHFSGHFGGHFGDRFSGHFSFHFSSHFSGLFRGHFSGHFTSAVTSVITPIFTSNSTSIFTLIFTPIFTSVFNSTLMMLSFYSTPQTTAEHLFTFHSHLITHNTCHYSICKKRFEKGISAEIYYLFASERLLIYLHPIFSHQKLNLRVF